MGFWDTITDLVEAAAPWSTADAEAPESAPEESKSDDAPESSKEGEAETEDDKSEDKEEESSEDAPEEEEEEEEEEDEDDDEPKDPKEELEEQCKESKQCSPAKHHYDECVERVTGAGDDSKEDCVEEFFHLAHCATQCAAPKLWSVLK